MNPDTTFFLQILADYVNRRKTAPNDGADWSRILELAQKHKLESVVYLQCRRIIPRELLPGLGVLYAGQVTAYKNIAAAAAELGDVFTKEAIPFFIAKGLELAALYPQPASRSMGDLDLVVHSADKERAHQVMTEKLGFQILIKMDFEWIYQRDSVKIEIHDHLIYYNFAMFRENKDFFERAWEHTHSLPDTAQRSLDWDFHMVYLILHLKKHFLMEGVGFRLFLDLAIVAESGLLHWDVLRGQLEQARLLEFAETCFALCERWFDMKLPLTRPISDAFYREAVDTTLANGVYGGSGEEVKSNQVMTHMLLSGKGKAALEKLFPPYSVLRTRPGYTFVDGKPWLMPVLWIYRMGHALVVGDAAVQARRLKEMDSGDLSERKAVLQEWHLLEDRESSPDDHGVGVQPAPLLSEKDVLLMRCLFGGGLSAASARALTDGLDVDTGDFHYMQYLSALGHKYGWDSFPAQMVPRFQGFHRYFQVQDAMGLANLCQLGRLLHGAGIPVMLLGQDAMRIRYAPDLARIMQEHDIAVRPEDFARAERLMAANGYLRFAGGAGSSSWTFPSKKEKAAVKVHSVLTGEQETDNVWSRAEQITYNEIPFRVIGRTDLCLQSLNKRMLMYAPENCSGWVRDWVCNCRCLFPGELDLPAMLDAARPSDSRYCLCLLLEQYQRCFPDAFSPKELDHALPDREEYLRWKKKLAAYPTRAQGQGAGLLGDLAFSLSLHRAKAEIYRLSLDQTHRRRALSGYLKDVRGEDSLFGLLKNSAKRYAARRKEKR